MPENPIDTSQEHAEGKVDQLKRLFSELKWILDTSGLSESSEGLALVLEDIFLGNSEVYLSAIESETEHTDELICSDIFSKLCIELEPWLDSEDPRATVLGLEVCEDMTAVLCADIKVSENLQTYTIDDAMNTIKQWKKDFANDGDGRNFRAKNKWREINEIDTGECFLLEEDDDIEHLNGDDYKNILFLRKIMKLLESEKGEKIQGFCRTLLRTVAGLYTSSLINEEAQRVKSLGAAVRYIREKYWDEESGFDEVGFSQTGALQKMLMGMLKSKIPKNPPVQTAQARQALLVSKCADEALNRLSRKPESRAIINDLSALVLQTREKLIS